MRAGMGTGCPLCSGTGCDPVVVVFVRFLWLFQPLELDDAPLQVVDLITREKSTVKDDDEEGGGDDAVEEQEVGL